MKHLYKILVLFILFIVSIFYFGRTIPEISVATTTATSLKDSTFPLVYLQLGDYTVNTLHGYGSRLDSGLVRESITPLDTEKKFTVKIKQNGTKIKKLNYELLDIANKKVIESGSMTAFDSEGNNRSANLKLSEGLDTSKEYGFQITLITNYSKKIYFYTRIKYYSSDFFLDKKLDFVQKFHNATYGKEKDFKFTSYLEANTNEDATFANVDIHSSQSMITWKKLKPKIITDVIPTINELNIETAAVSLTYFIEINTDSAVETYAVKECYRVRYSGSRIYLLAFRRTAEALFDPNLVSLKKSEFKIGISDESNLELASSESNKQVAFVRNGDLWYYNLKDNRLTSVFSFSYGSDDYLMDHYNEHDAKILNIDNDGNISFMVYGYMNCGDYEGRVGVLLYDYDAKKNQILERVYLPLTITYQQLKEDIGEFSYVNDKNIFYFSLNDKVYAYNLASKQYEYLTENASRDNFSMLREAKSFIWSNLGDNGQADSITILDLDTSKSLEVDSPASESIVVLGTIDSNIIYGFVRNSDIYESSTGDIVTPAYKLMIADCKGKILREYGSKNRYVTGAYVEDNVIHLKRVQKKGGKFSKVSDDTIMNQKNTRTKSVRLTTRVTDRLLTENYLSLPAGFVLEKKPELAATKQVMVTENTTLHLPDNEMSSSPKYYIYVNGEITKSTTNAAKAIQEADNQMGTVMDNSSHIVWERGGKFLSKQIGSISYPSDNSSSTKSAAQMLLQAAQVTVSTSQLKGRSIFSMLKGHLERPVALTGCTLDEVLYFVSGEKPVIGMIDNGHAVLITEYTTSEVTWMDPVSKTKKTMSLQRAENLFKRAGYRFVSYISN